jgi:hypothetical protein
MHLTKEEWNRQAERAAAASFGEKHAGYYTFKRYAAGPLGILGLAGLLIGGATWAWNHVHLPSAGTGPAHLPVLFWVFLIGLAIGTVVAFRPGRIVPAAAVLMRAVVFSLLWLGVVTYGIVVLI